MSTSNFSTYDQVGKKEDISDTITNLSPMDVPFQSSIGTEGIHNVVHQWQEDSLIDAGVNSAIEGADAPSAVQNATVMRSNVSQIFTKTAKATGTADAVTTYGRAKELAYQMGLRSKEIKRDREYALVGVDQAAVNTNVATARKMASVSQQIDATLTYTVNSTGGALNSGVGSPTAAPLREDIITTVSQAAYTAGADPSVLMVKPADAVIVAGFQANSRTRYVENGDRKIVNAVDVYVSPFGDLKVVKNRFIKTTDALVYDPSMWKILVLRNWRRWELAKTGDSTNMQILGEFSNKHRNFKASGRVTNLT